MFLSGINHIFYHGACYSPDEAPWPGWVFYASTEMNPRNSIWHDVPTLNEYVARCQAVLQSGKPDNDVLLYWPVSDFWYNPAGRLQPMAVSRTNWFENQPIGKTAHELWNRGYAFDYVSDRQLQSAKVMDGKIQMPGGSYRVIVVPECKYIPLETFKKLLALAESGASVIFEKQLPTDISGLNNFEKQRDDFKKLLEGVKLTQRVHTKDPKFVASWMQADFGKGQIFVGEVPSALFRAHVKREPLVDAGLSFVRRTVDGSHQYFIANRSETNFDGWISFDRVVKAAVILDPLTGKSGVALIKPFQIYLQLRAGESLILRAFDDRKIAGPKWNYWQTNGHPVEINGQWNVKFIQGGPTIPAPFQTAKLGSWTDDGDTNAQVFAGSAIYSINFDASSGDSKKYFLDLGDVRQSARVKLNGKDYGTLITPPFRVVMDNLQPKDNVLEVEVTSVSANRIRDLDRRGPAGAGWKIFKDINIVNVNYRPFNAADWPLTECGLLGPVTLTAVVAATPSSP